MACTNKTKIDDLHAMSLPNPCLSLMYPEVLRTNFELLDQRFPIHDGSTHRSLVLITVNYSKIPFLHFLTWCSHFVGCFLTKLIL